MGRGDQEDRISRQGTAQVPPGTLVWDDELWAHVWERTLSQVERHSIAMDVLRRRVPRQPLEARIAVELARRWRRTARNLAVLYALWSMFWGTLAWHDWAADARFEALLTPTCTALGLVAVAVCAAFRRYVRPVASRRATVV